MDHLTEEEPAGALGHASYDRATHAAWRDVAAFAAARGVGLRHILGHVDGPSAMFGMVTLLIVSA